MTREEKQLANRYIPKDSDPLEHPDGLGIVYLYTNRAGKPGAVAYRGKAGKASFHYYYRDVPARTLAVAYFFDSLDEHKQRVRNYRKEQYEPHNFKVGDIVQNSWGYDQTNVDFYEIVKTSDHYVWLQELQQSTTATGFMCGSTVPLAGMYRDGKPEKHRANKHGVSMKHGSGSLWEYNTVGCSWGH